MGRDSRSRSRSSGLRGQSKQSPSHRGTMSQSHGQSSWRRPEPEGLQERRRRSRGPRSDSGRDRWPKSGRRSGSPRPPRWQSQDQSSSSDSGEERAQDSRARQGHRRSGSPRSSVSSSHSPRRSRSPRAGAPTLSQQQQSLQERLRLREERRRQEELLKASETPEEKRARRLAKREAKARRKREKMGWGEEYMGYSNSDNPFGDDNLLGTFIWNKALEKKGISHLEEKELRERTRRIQEDKRLELQKVKQRRRERERQKALREQELELLQREKEARHWESWEEQEDSFHLRQAKLRSEIRIRDGRAKPIDLLAKYVSAEDGDLAVGTHEPYTFLTGLPVADMEDLLEDIQVYVELERGKNVDFWRDMTALTEDAIAKLRKLEASGKGPGERREGVNASVSSDVQSVFQGKTYDQLQAIFQAIEGKIQAGGPNLDMGYWESLLQQVRAHAARARLRERHRDVLLRKLFRLKQEQGVESDPLLFPKLQAEPAELAPSPGPSSVDPAAPEGALAPGEAQAVLMQEDVVQQSPADYDAGRWSPRLLAASELPLDANVLEPHEDLQRLQLSRQQLQATGDASQSAEDIFFQRAREGMGQDEAQFSAEMPLAGRAYLWADKYRPRKPRFFNRVHTGFEWNKYNRTHYDLDNPPPKMVQGYKFNIFYPDLIRKRATPEYSLEACSDNPDLAVLRFHAGPPYEDIAFKIVSREWDHSHRHGFRCQFANGIFQLWFHFKRYRYRR